MYVSTHILRTSTLVRTLTEVMHSPAPNNQLNLNQSLILSQKTISSPEEMRIHQNVSSVPKNFYTVLKLKLVFPKNISKKQHNKKESQI